VLLGWSQGDATVLVCTSGRGYYKAEARWRTAHLALGGTLPRTPMSTAEKGRELERVRDDAELWSPSDGPIPGSSEAEVAHLEGYTLAYGIQEHGAVLLAAAGPIRKDMLVRQVRDWSPYGVDATREFTT
jgi:hypothetical protein